MWPLSIPHLLVSPGVWNMHAGGLPVLTWLHLAALHKQATLLGGQLFCNWLIVKLSCWCNDMMHAKAGREAEVKTSG